MRTVLLTLVVAGATLHAPSAQVRYSERDFQDYYRWFQSVSPTDAQQRKGAQLLIFSPATPLRSAPFQTAGSLAYLPIGGTVTNLVGHPFDAFKDEINGYSDRWFRVGTRIEGAGWVEGYVWGADIARAWTRAALFPGEAPALAMLGIGGDPIRHVSEMQGEVRIVHDQTLIQRIRIEKMCLFSECDSDALLRVLPDQPRPGQLLFEATSLISNCSGSSIEKAFFVWTGGGLRSIYHAEYTTGYTFSHTPLRVENEKNEPLECRYLGEDQSFNPIWACTAPAAAQGRPAEKVIRAR